MARKSLLEREKRREKLVMKYMAKREMLKEKIKNKEITNDERTEYVKMLQKYQGILVHVEQGIDAQ